MFDWRMISSDSHIVEPKTGIKTPGHEIDLVRERLKRLKEMLK